MVGLVTPPPVYHEGTSIHEGHESVLVQIWFVLFVCIRAVVIKGVGIDSSSIQNLIRTASWNARGSPTAVICPKVDDGFVG